jgi:tripartite tricarboxylate transporter TctB family protein
MPNSFSVKPEHVREMIVPAIMIGGIGLYLYDSLHLSYEALVFPAVLIMVIVGAVAWTLVTYFAKPPTAVERERLAAEGDDEIGPILDARPWLMVALPTVLVAALDYLGTLTALIVLVFGAQVIFGLRSPLKSLLIAIAVVAPTYIVFKYFLYARFPAGLLGIG